jgi:hypothetical protein
MQMSDDEEKTHNIFDKPPPEAETVPVTMEVDGEKLVVGEAQVWLEQDGYVHTSMTLKNDNPEEVKKLFADGIQAYSIDEVAPDVTEEEAEALFEFPPHEHKPVQHRDGRPPWCDICGLDVSLQTPARPPWQRDVPDNFGFGKPSRFGED